MRSFFLFYGSKHRLSKKLPSPTYDTIIEPFAGSAGYATLYYNKQVVLNDADPTIAGIWEFLARASSSEILALPLVTDLDDLPSTVPQEAADLIGYWLQAGRPTPRRQATMARLWERPNSCWGESVREVLAKQVELIKHWEVHNKSWEELENRKGTWLIDPPYKGAEGRAYKYNEIDYKGLGAWCKERRGQVIVHEKQGASWLPFQPLASMKTTADRVYGDGSQYTEVVWYKDTLEERGETT